MFKTLCMGSRDHDVMQVSCGLFSPNLEQPSAQLAKNQRLTKIYKQTKICFGSSSQSKFNSFYSLFRPNTQFRPNSVFRPKNRNWRNAKYRNHNLFCPKPNRNRKTLTTKSDGEGCSIAGVPTPAATDPPPYRPSARLHCGVWLETPPANRICLSVVAVWVMWQVLLTKS